jgi:hypothetical protein
LVVPRTHACLLPVTNTTAELLAEYLGRQAWSALRQERIPGLARLVLEVEESTGQTASMSFAD